MLVLPAYRSVLPAYRSVFPAYGTCYMSRSGLIITLLIFMCFMIYILLFCFLQISRKHNLKHMTILIVDYSKEQMQFLMVDGATVYIFHVSKCNKIVALVAKLLYDVSNTLCCQEQKMSQ